MWTLQAWGPVGITTVLIGLALWLFRSLISARLTASVKNEFNTQLENIKAELRAKEAQIDALRSGAMSGLINRQGKLYERQLQAIEQIWEAVAELSKAKFVSATLAKVKYDEIAKRSKSDEKVREFVKALGGGFDIKELDLSVGRKARPFLSPLAWAYYSAYEAIVTHAVMKYELLKYDIDSPSKLLNTDKVTDVIKEVLPHYTDYVDKHDSSVLHFLLDDIENLLLGELQNIHKGIESDEENAERAASIIAKADSLAASEPSS